MSGPREQGGDPWADPATPTQAGAPYPGPPSTGPMDMSAGGYGHPGYGYAAPGYPASGYLAPGYPASAYPAPGYPASGYPAPGYPAPGYPAPAPWGWAPGPARRPGQVVTSAVLAFVQAAGVLVASLYLYVLVSVARLAASSGTGFPVAETGALVVEGRTILLVQLASAVALVAAGVWALLRRTRASWTALVAGFAVQVVLAGYWAIRLGDVESAARAGLGGVLTAFTLFFVAAPVVGIGLLLSGPGRRWYAERTDGAPAA